MKTFLIKDGVLMGYNGYETDVVLPDGVETIGAWAFERCKKLRRITLPDSLKVIEAHAFDGCIALEDIVGSDAAFGLAWTQLTPHEKVLFCCRRLAAGYTLREREKTYICRAIDSIAQTAIRNNVPRVLAAALEIKKTVPPEMLDRWIAACEKAVDMRAMLMEYKHRLFDSRDLERIETRREEKALGLRERTVADWRAIFRFRAKDGEVTITGIKTDEPDVVIPPKIGRSAVTAIGELAFQNCKTLVTVTVPDTVKTIGSLAFYACTNLTHVTLSEGLKTIGGSAFEDCRALTSIHIPDSVTLIGLRAFTHCRALASVTGANGVKHVFEGAFHDTAWLDPKTDAVLGGILLQSGAQTETATVPAGVTTVGDSAFKHRNDLKAVVIPQGVTTVCISAFAYCGELLSVTIPDSVTNIGSLAFCGCPKLTICGKAGSFAQRYATVNNIPFVTIAKGK